MRGLPAFPSRLSIRAYRPQGGGEGRGEEGRGGEMRGGEGGEGGGPDTHCISSGPHTCSLHPLNPLTISSPQMYAPAPRCM